ncbi:hypothetical protein GCM10009678_05720 [Actinomadura kijaniata]|uniref:Uncharacterized protein n=1 Tax=Actinomadura namibiensis TaxID=182080 RepID=A0A7W3LLP7_ACTNM|nr:hypothetical protein [Actinomadura namibiensis]MBA8950463.1 hypothetical protein [Actinomadura namibiensis]
MTSTDTTLDALVHDLDRGRSVDMWVLVHQLVDAAGDPKAGEAALRALSSARPGAWTRIDDEVRSHSAYRGTGKRWRAVVAAARHGEDPLAVLLAACSHDGREREAALSAPAMRLPSLLPVLMIRATDWAAPVRRKARAVLEQVAPDPGRAAAMALHLRERWRGQDVMDALLGELHDAPEATLHRLRADGDRRVRRLAYRIWLDGRAGLEEAVAAAMTEPDTVCRRLAVADAVARAVRDARTDLLEHLLTSRSAPTRADALTGLVTLGRPERGRAFLADRSAAVRAVAQWAVRRAGGDPAEEYRAALDAGGPRTAALIAGLAECGGRDDARRMPPFLGHERVRVRAEAVRAVRLLGGPVEQAAELIADPSPRVVREVERALGPSSAVPSPELLWSLLDDGERPYHVRLAAAGRLTRRDTATRVEAVLRLLMSGDAVLWKRGADEWDRLARDSTAFYGAVTPPARERLAALITAAGPVLGPRRADWLRLWLGLPR